MQNELFNLLHHAVENVEFYKNIFSDTDLYNIKNASDLFEMFPIIDKQKIKHDYLSFIDKRFTDYMVDLFDESNLYPKNTVYSVNGYNLIFESTSGTTGSPFITFKSAGERVALGRNHWKLRNAFSPVNPSDIFNFIHTESSHYMFPFSESVDEEERVLNELNFLVKSSYSWWHVNAKLLHCYCKYLDYKNFNFNHLRVIENAGSFITEEEKEKFRKAFSCRVTNQYGCTEVWAMAYDCRDGHLHVNERSILLELVDDNGVVIKEYNAIGYVTVTSLKQKCMPFIRYKLNDLAYYMSGECTCGNKNKRIVIIPNRHTIIGTELYGSECFRNIVVTLVANHQISKFDSISVSQTERKLFIVNIKGNREQPNVIEKHFIKAASTVFGHTDYKYIFTYNNNLETNNIFTVIGSSH